MQRATPNEVQPHIVYMDDVDQRDAIDGLLGVLSVADFMTPAIALARGGATLAIPRHEAAEAAEILEAARIASWSWAVSGDYVLCDVDRKQARRACRLLALEYHAPPPAWTGRVWLVFALLSGLGLAAAMFLAVTGGAG